MSAIEVTQKDAQRAQHELRAMLAQATQVVQAMQRIIYGRPPVACPYCQSTNISGGRGHWDCDDCGRGGSY